MYQISDQNEIQFGNVVAKFVFLKEKEEGPSENQKDVKETNVITFFIKKK